MQCLVRRDFQEFFCYDHTRSLEKCRKHSGTERSTGLMLCACCSQVVILYLHQHKLAENCKLSVVDA